MVTIEQVMTGVTKLAVNIEQVAAAVTTVADSMIALTVVCIVVAVLTTATNSGV